MEIAAGLARDYWNRNKYRIVWQAGKALGRMAKRKRHSSHRRSKRHKRAKRSSKKRVQYNIGQRPRFVDNSFKKKRFNVKRIRRALWRDTEFSTHYRSLSYSAQVTTINTTVPQGTGPVLAFPMISFNTTPGYTSTAFWTPGGGLQPHFSGGGNPSVPNDVILRGGMCKISFCPNSAATIPIRLKLWVIRTNRRPDVAIYNTYFSNVPGPTSQVGEWDPTLIPDFNQQFGKVKLAKEVILLQGAQPVEFCWKQKIEKLDQNIFLGVPAAVGPPVLPGIPAGACYWWCWQLVPLEAVGTAETVQVITSWNLSFSTAT